MLLVGWGLEGFEMVNRSVLARAMGTINERLKIIPSLFFSYLSV